MISKIAVNRPVTMIMILIAILLLGALGTVSLPQALMPDMDFPYAYAMVTYGGAGPEEVNTMITTPMEQTLSALEGVKEMSSRSYEGMCFVILEFETGTDLNVAVNDMRERLSALQSRLPDEASSPTIMKVNIDSMPVMRLYAASDKTVTELTEILDDNIIPRLSRISGVASATMTGQAEDVVNIEFEQDKLSGYGLSLSTLGSMIAAENISYPSGTIKNGHSEVIVRTYGQFSDTDEIGDLPVTLNDGSVLRLKEISTITYGVDDPDSITRINGQRGIGIRISKASDANIVEISNRVQAEMQSIMEEYEGQLTMTVGFDQSSYVRRSISSVAQSALTGAILAIIVIFVFLRNVRSTLVIALSIPASMLATFGMMYVVGYTLNMMTLGALTLSIGMVVDNSVVVLENIFRLNSLGYDSKRAAIDGSGQVLLSVVASTLTSIVVYLPIAFSGGLAGMVFQSFAFTIILTLLCSLVVSITVVPTLSSKLLDSSLSTEYMRIGPVFYRFKIITLFGKFIDWMTLRYKWLLYRGLKHRALIIILFIVIFVMSIFLVTLVEMELMPTMDQGVFTISIDMPYGTSLEDKDEYIGKIEEYMLDIPEIEYLTVNVQGAASSATMSSSSTIEGTLVHVSKRNRTTQEIVDQVEDHFKDLAGAEISYSVTSAMGSSSATGGSADYTVNVTGNMIDSVMSDTEELTDEIKKLGCVYSAENDMESGTPEVKVILNRSNAANYGITSYQVASALSTALSGSTSSRLRISGDEIDINLKLADRYTESIEDMKSVQITSARGINVSVGDIAELEYDTSPSAIRKTSQNYQQSIQINFNDNVSVNQGTEQVKAVVDDFVFEEGNFYTEGGQREQMMESFSNLGLALIVALGLVYIVLASQFESFILPIMVMMSIPFAMSGAFLLLFLTDSKLSMSSFTSLIVLVGIVVNNAIILIEFIDQNKEIMGRNTAIIESGATRLRPILMTTITTILGMLPMALGLGEGTEMMAPMALAIIGGLTMSTIVTLFLIPTLYSIVDDIETRRADRRAANKRINLYREARWLAKAAPKRERKQLRLEQKTKSENEDKN